MPSPAPHSRTPVPQTPRSVTQSNPYRQTYMANLNAQVAINNKNLQANRTQPALNQYVTNGGTPPPPSNAIGYVQAKGTKVWTRK